MTPVQWEILSVDEVSGDVVVRFFNESKENKVMYSWEGDKDQLISRLNYDAAQYIEQWKISPISSSLKEELLNLTGTVTID